MTDRVLVLIRHAKAVLEAATDAQRPLAGRGHRDAEAAGEWLARLGISLDLAVVSPATRARQTWAGIEGAMSARSVVVDERIYDNTVEGLLALVTETPDDVAGLALVGHNPSMHGLALTLDDGDGAADHEHALRDGYPTCGIAVFDVAGSWESLDHGSARLRTFEAPRG